MSRIRTESSRSAPVRPHSKRCGRETGTVLLPISRPSIPENPIGKPSGKKQTLRHMLSENSPLSSRICGRSVNCYASSGILLRSNLEKIKQPFCYSHKGVLIFLTNYCLHKYHEIKLYMLLLFLVSRRFKFPKKQLLKLSQVHTFSIL